MRGDHVLCNTKVWSLLTQNPGAAFVTPRGWVAVCAWQVRGTVLRISSFHNFDRKWPVSRVACESALAWLHGALEVKDTRMRYGFPRRGGGSGCPPPGSVPKADARTRPGGGRPQAGHVGVTRHQGKAGAPQGQGVGEIGEVTSGGSPRGADAGGRAGQRPRAVTSGRAVPCGSGAAGRLGRSAAVVKC